MRTTALVIVAASLFFVATGEAGPTPTAPPTISPTSLPGPIAVIQPPLAFNSVRRTPTAKGAPDTSRYSTGPISLDVEIVNPAKIAQTGTLKIISHLEDPTEQTLTVDVPANGQKFVTFTDPRGLLQGCASNFHRIELGAARKLIEVRPSCTFTVSAIVDPTAGYTADRLLAVRQGKLHYTSAKIDNSPSSCTTLLGSARVFNGTTSAITAKYTWGPKLDDTEFTLAPGAAVTQRFNIPFEGRVGAASNRLGLRAAGAAVMAEQFQSYVDVTRSCALDVRLGFAPP